MHALQLLAAPAEAPGISGGQIFGAVTAAGAALVAGTGLVLGLKGSDWGPIKIENKKKAAWWGIVTGTIWVAAGGTWAEIANGIGSVPPSLFGNGSDFGNPGQGAIAIFLTLLAFGPKWGSRTAPPAIIGLMAGVIYGTAGGVWGILVNVVRMLVGIITGQG